MGIGGSGAKGVAQLAKDLGYGVSGCDLNLDGHSEKHLENIDLLVVSPAVLYQNKKHAELLQGLKRNIVITWEEFLGKELLKNKKLICVAGTHGKSTTTAMAAQLLINAGFDPTVVIGAYVPEWKGNSRVGKSEWAIVEADEFNDNFLNYSPDIILLNNIEFDHPDFFKNISQVKKSFKKFVNNLKGQKLLLTEKDRPNKKFKLKIIGEHNQKNANMVYLLGKKLGIPDKKIIKSIENFKGIGRRMELISDKNGVKVFDDYAHHPTAIKTTLEGLRKEFPNKKILAIIEPHGYKRTKVLLAEYKGVFDSVDSVIIGPIFKARDVVDVNITPEKIAKISGHKNVISANSFEEIENCLAKRDSALQENSEIGNYDVIVVMGAGQSNIWAQKISEI